MTNILFFGEPLIRITPIAHASVSDAVTASIHFGGSEVNIARNLAGFGVSTKMLTALPNTAIGNQFIDFLNSHHIDTSAIQRVGQRIGLYYLEEGYGIRNSNVYYDRLHTSITEMKDLDFDAIFKNITHFHFSGITVAISKSVRSHLEQLLQEAKKRNIIISMDLNFRSKMISVADAKKEFSHFAKYADYCFGIEPLMKDDKDMNMFDKNNATIETIKERMQVLQKKYQFKAIFHTIRDINIHQINRYQAFVLTPKTFHSSVVLETQMLERVGSGDAFVAGILYGIEKQLPFQEVINIGVACATYKCTCRGDSMFVPLKAVTTLISNTQEISR